MFFYFCLCLAAALTVYALVRYRRNAALQGGTAVPLVRLLLALALADTFLLYLPWFFYSWASESGTDMPALFLAPVMIVRLMQTVSLDADYEAALEVMGLAGRSGVSVAFLQFYAVVLSYVSVMVPLTGILTALSFFRNGLSFRLAVSRFGRKKVFFIFGGVSERSLTLAESICASPEAHRASGFIFCHTGETEDPSLAERVQKTGGWYTAEQPADLLRLLLRGKKRQIRYCLLEDENRNFDDAVAILKRVGAWTGHELPDNGKSPLWREASRVRIDMLLHSDELDHILDAQEKYGIFVRIMDQERLYAEDLFLRWPLFTGARPGSGELSLLVTGEGDVAEEILRESIWLGQMAGLRLRILFVSRAAQRIRKKLLFSCPGLFAPDEAGGMTFSLEFKEGDCADVIRGGAEDIRRCGYVIVAGRDDEENIRLAMHLRTWFVRNLRLDPDYPLRGTMAGKVPFIAVCVRDERRASHVEQLCVQESREPYNLRTFGTEGRIFTHDSLMQSMLTESLLRIQLSYHLQDTGREAAEEERQAAWQELSRSVYNCRSTEANALYLTTRLYDAGVLSDIFRQREILPPAAEGSKENLIQEPDGEQLAILLQEAPGDPALREDILSLYDRKLREDPGLLEKLAEAEHRRWNAYMVCSGWIRMPMENLRMEHAAGRGHKDYQSLQHACIAPWEELPEISLAVTDGTDADKYQDADREMVLRLREFLWAG